MKKKLIKGGWCPDCLDLKYTIKIGAFIMCPKCGVSIATDCTKPLTKKEIETLNKYKSYEDGWGTKFYISDLERD